MIDDNDFNLDSEIFDGAIELQRHERGASFGLDPMTYFRLARCCNDAGSMGVEPSVISRLSTSERGVKVILFGSRFQFDVVVRPLRACVATIIVSAQALDAHSLHCRIPVCSGDDSDRSWSRALRGMLEMENVAYYDSWSQEQDDDGDGGVEAS